MPHTELHHTKIQEAFSAALDHPIRSSFKFLRPNFMVRNTVKNTAFKIAMQLCLMGRVDDVNALKDTKTYQGFMGSVYDVFSKISQEDATFHNHKNISSLKKLKKKIHDIARLIGEKQRIINVAKYRLQAAKKSRNDYDLSIYNSNQAYTVLTLHQNETDIAIKNERRKKRKLAKLILNCLSFFVSLLVGVGEGMVALVFSSATWVFFPAFLCNYFLFRSDSYIIFKDIYFRKIWNKENGGNLSKREKGLIFFTLIFTASAGISFGFISFGTALTAIGHLFFGLTAAAAMSAPPVGLAVIAAIVATVTAIALFTAFSYMITKFVRSDILEKTKIIPSQIKDFYTKEWVKCENFSQKSVYIVKKSLESIIHLTCMALALTISTIVIIASCALMKSSATNILHKTLKISTTIANKAANIIALALGSACNGLFYAKGIFEIINTLKHIPLTIAHPKKTWHAIQSNYRSNTANKYQLFQSIKVGLSRLFLFSCCIINGYAQSKGFSGNHSAKNNVSKVFHINNPKEYVGVATAIGSAGPNILAANNVINDNRVGLFSQNPAQHSNTQQTAVSRGFACSQGQQP